MVSMMLDAGIKQKTIDTYVKGKSADIAERAISKVQELTS